MSILLRGMDLGRAEGMAEGIARGKAEGMAQGKAEGRLEGQITDRADVILELLEEHGTVPDNVRELIRGQKDWEILKSWSKLAAKAESVEAFVSMIQS